jgi:hypothetical protein
MHYQMIDILTVGRFGDWSQDGIRSQVQNLEYSTIKMMVKRKQMRATGELLEFLMKINCIIEQ